MITVKLMGGLGNQMFQYAAGRALSLRHNVPLALDLSFLQAPAGGKHTQRQYELGGLNIHATTLNSGDMTNFSESPGAMRRILMRLFPGFFSGLHLAESGHGYQGAFDRAPSDTYLDGFWQNERYFARFAPDIRAELTPAPHESVRSSDVARMTGSTASISVHVRRGDYVSSAEANAFHGTCGVDYYHEAISFIAKTVDSPLIFVFSDDPEWCRANLAFRFPTHYLQPDAAAANDMWLMSRCSHHVIANSSFSWWGAWLNERDGNTTVAPKEWFRGRDSKQLGVVPARWTTL
jgi:hypothetical protein